MAWDILRTVGLDGVADDRVSSFSGGMKRRLSIGVSTIGDPKVPLSEIFLARGIDSL